MKVRCNFSMLFCHKTKNKCGSSYDSLGPGRLWKDFKLETDFPSRMCFCWCRDLLLTINAWFTAVSNPTNMATVSNLATVLSNKQT